MYITLGFAGKLSAARKTRQGMGALFCRALLDRGVALPDTLRTHPRAVGACRAPRRCRMIWTISPPVRADALRAVIMSDLALFIFL